MSAEIRRLIEASSLGTPEAKAARASVDPALAAEVVRRSQQLTDACPLCRHVDHEGPCLVIVVDGREAMERPCLCYPCEHCHGYGAVPTGRHDRRGEALVRDCGVCDGWGRA